MIYAITPTQTPKKYNVKIQSKSVPVAHNISFSKDFMNSIYGFKFKEAAKETSNWIQKSKDIDPLKNVNIKVIMAYPRLANNQRDFSKKIPYIIMKPDIQSRKSMLKNSQKIPLTKLPFWKGTHNLQRVLKKLVKLYTKLS